MFDFLKRKKRITSILGVMWPLLSLYCLDDDGKLDEDVEVDNYILAYLYGMLTKRLLYMNIDSVKETGLIMRGVYKYIFPDSWQEIMEHNNTMIRDNDIEFKKIATLAYNEMAEIDRMTLKHGEAAIDLIKPTSLQKHLKKYYMNK